MSIAVIGCGVVGSAVAQYYIDEGLTVVKEDPKFNQPDQYPEILKCDLAFVCGPTLTHGYKQDLSVIHIIMNKLSSINYPGIVVLKSTVLPGTCEMLQKKHPNLRIVHNPEFLTAKTPYEDFVTQNVVLLSGKEAKAAADLVYKPYGFHCVTHEDYRYTEMSKYLHNTFLALKVAYMHSFYLICKKSGMDYNIVKDMAVAQERIGINHTTAPGDDGLGYGGMCLTSDTKIATEQSSKPITEIKEGDVILDREGTTVVTQTGKRVVDEIIKITARGRTIKGSADHIHLVMGKNGLEEKLLKDISARDWIPVIRPPKNNDYIINMGKKPSNRIQVWQEQVNWSHQLAYVLGLWAADGCRSHKEHSVQVSLGEKKIACRDKYIECLKYLGFENPYVRYSETPGTYGLSKLYIVRVRSLWLYSLIDQLGMDGIAKTKKCPIVPNEFISSFVGGWLDGDGCLSGSTIEGYSESTELISGIDRLLLTKGICASINKKGKAIRISMREDIAEVSSWTERLKNTFDYKMDDSYASPNMRKTDFGWAVAVSKVESLPGDVVYSLETKSHTYVANSLLTHNCFPKDTKAFLDWLYTQGFNKEAMIGTTTDIFNDWLRSLNYN